MKNKITITKCFLDLDGCVANFCKAAAKAMNKSYPVEPFAVPNGWLDDKEGTLWKHCRGHNFWENIEPFPWKDSIIKIVDKNVSNWKFMSKPSCDPGSYSGKYEWVKRHVKVKGGGINRLWLVNGSKAFACTGPHHLLIDDNKRNCDEWEAAGGTVYRWPEISENWPKEEVNRRLNELNELLGGGIMRKDLTN